MIEAVMRTLYRSSRTRRHYQSKDAAFRAEARAIISEKYPAEKADYDEYGRMTDPGFYWQGMQRSEVLYRRMVRLVRAAHIKSKEAP